MKLMASGRIYSCFAVLLLLASNGAASDSSMDRATLHGLKAVKVAVDPPPTEMEREGLDREHLRARIEQKLRDAGIAIDNDAVEFLGLSISSARGGRRNPLSLMIGLGLYQVVTLSRDKTAKTVAETWGEQKVMSAPPKALGDAASSTVDEMADDFVKAYRSVNPQ
jgi:hypothetical protein